MTKGILLTALTAGALSLSLASAQAQAPAAPHSGTFSVDVFGNVQSASLNGPQAFQIGPAANVGQLTQQGDPALDGTPGTFSNYQSTGSAPAISGGDLSQYGFSLYATPSAQNPATPNLVDYNGTFRIFAPGYGYNANDGQVLETGEFSAVAAFTDPFTASVTGFFNADPGGLRPPGFPDYVDFSGASPALFTGTFSSNPNTGAQTLSGHLQTIAAPEPGAVVPFAIGALALGGLTLRRKRAGATA